MSLLSISEFVYNNLTHFITEMSLFIMYCKYNLRNIEAQEDVNKL